MMSLLICILLFLNSFVISENANTIPAPIETVVSGLQFVEVAQQISDSNSSVECAEQVSYLLNNEPNALFQMADAWSKFPYPGAYYYASKTDWGNYDECVEVSVKNNTILGKFCPWGYILPSDNTTGYLLAYCVPHKCSAQDLSTVTGLQFNEIYCSTKNTDREIDKEAIITIIIFGLLFICLVWSTSYDVYLHYSGKKPVSRYFLAFSLYTNGKKLLQSSRLSHVGDQILSFHGMKFISMWWIISSHGAISFLLAPMMNEEKRAKWQLQQYTEYITSAEVCFDTFFYISGFLLAYTYFRQELSKQSIKQQIVKFPKIVLHRYLRLTAPNVMCFIGSVFVFKYLQNGPFFSYGVRNNVIKPCKQNWWTYFLYIQNYYNVQHDEYLCIPPMWYLSADFQLFIFASLALIPLSQLYRKSFKKTIVALTLANMVFFCFPIFIRFHWRNYEPHFLNYDTHSNLISYFIGVMAGVYMRHEKNKKMQISKITNFSLWTLSLFTMFGIVYYRQKTRINSDYIGKTLCYSFTKPIWCFVLVWITYACAKGYGGVVNWLLSSRFMQLGGKLFLCLYIVHGMVIDHSSLGLRNQLYFSDWHIFYQNCGHFVVSMLVATFWALSYEMPMATLLKLFFGHRKSNKILIPRAKLKRTSLKCS